MSEAKVKISVETAQATASLEKLGKTFTDMGSRASKGVAQASNSAVQGSASAKLMGDRIGETVKSFIAFEFAKKIVQMADATMRAAESMKGLSAETRASAAAYVENTAKAKESLDQIILMTSGFMGTLAEYAAEGLGYWATIFGADPDAGNRELQILRGKFADTKLLVTNDAKEMKRLNQARLSANSKDELDAIDRQAEATQARLDNNSQTLVARQKAIDAKLVELGKDASAEKLAGAKRDAAQLLQLKLDGADSELAKLKLKYDADMANDKTSEEIKEQQEILYYSKVEAIRKRNIEKSRADAGEMAKIDVVYAEFKQKFIDDKNAAVLATMDDGPRKERAQLESAQKEELDAVRASGEKLVAERLAASAKAYAAVQKKSAELRDYPASLAGKSLSRFGKSIDPALAALAEEQNQLEAVYKKSMELEKEAMLSRDSAIQTVKEKQAIDTEALGKKQADDRARARQAASDTESEAEIRRVREGGDKLQSAIAEAYAPASGILTVESMGSERWEEYYKVSTAAAEKTANAIQAIQDQADIAAYDKSAAHALRMAGLTETRMDDLEVEYDRKKALADIEIKDEEERAEYLRMLKVKYIKEVADVQKAADEASLGKQHELAEATATSIGQIASLVAQGDMKERGRRQAYKALAISEVAINTAVGVSKAFAVGGPLGFITGAGIIAAGIAQEEQIRNQKFAAGGIVQGPRSGDTVPIRANGGEMVLTEMQQSKLFAMANGQGGGGESIVVNYSPTISGGNVGDISKMLQDNHAAFGRYIKSVVSDPSFSRKQRAL